MNDNTDGPVAHAGDFNFRDRSTVLDLAKWELRAVAGGLPLIAPIPTAVLQAVQLPRIEQYVTRHHTILDGKPIHFGDMITLGRVTFIQWRVKPLMYAMSLNALDGNVQHLRETFKVLCATGCVVAMMQAPPDQAKAPEFKVNFEG